MVFRFNVCDKTVLLTASQAVLVIWIVFVGETAFSSVTTTKQNNAVLCITYRRRDAGVM